MKTFRNYANYDQHKFCKDLRDVDWESVVKTKDSPGNVNGSSVINDLWTSFKGSFVSIVDKHAPLITKKVRGLTCPWMNGSIKREICLREFLLNKARRSNFDEDWSAYRRSRNRVTKLVRDIAENSLMKTVTILKSFGKPLSRSCLARKQSVLPVLMLMKLKFTMTRKLPTALIISSLKMWTDSFKFLDDVYHLHDRSNF